MQRFLPFVLLSLLVGCTTTANIDAIDEPPASGSNFPSIEEKTAGMEHHDGLFPLYWDDNSGKVWLEIPTLDSDFLYVNSLAAGLGSNDIGLDRSQLGSDRLVRFERVGPRILLVRPNLRYRAISDNPAEQLAVEDAFAEGVEWGFDIAAESNGRFLIDITSFLLRDAHGVARTLQNTGQGRYSADASRSSIVPEALKGFPRNSEMEARLTFTTESPGTFVRQTAADPYAVTVRLHHSFIELPPLGYEPREFDPRSGYFSMSYADYAAPIGEDVTQRLITRHRLHCASAPDADGLCEVQEPIVYYLDPGTPEPVRGALLDGARWWADAFRAAGFRDAYRVEIRPDSVDPLDVRYNTIQWVHRATRGWSYGMSVVDPRTGEILKGHVSLGSLRVRQDYLIAEGLLSPYDGTNAGGLSPEEDPMLEMALARIRQLSAHEVGHTLGLAHNFASSTNDRSSVMDYPAPLASTTSNGAIDLSEAYSTGVGEWDIQAIKYGYGQDPTGTLHESQAMGLRYLSDADARSPGAASPTAALWDNGNDAVESLQQQMAVRRTALDQFDESAIPEGRPMATLEEVLVPLYLGHRYQIEATAKLVGGVAYSYSIRGDDLLAPEPVSSSAQHDALSKLLEVLSPDELRLPDVALELIPPRPPGYYNRRELFSSNTYPTFDPIAPAEAIAGHVFRFLLNPQRAARLVYQADQNSDLPSLTSVIDEIDRAVFSATSEDPYEAEIARTVQTAWIDALLTLAGSSYAAPAVRVRISGHLSQFVEIDLQDVASTETAMHRQWLREEVQRWLNREFSEEEEIRIASPPPGSPIGQTSSLDRQQRRHNFIDRWMPEQRCSHESY